MSAQRVTELQTVPVLLAGASSALIPHTLRDGNGNALVPNWIYPTNPSTAVVPTSYTSAGVIYTNQGAAASAQVVFRVAYEHTLVRANTLAKAQFIFAGGGGGDLPAATCAETTRYEQYVTDVRSAANNGLLEPSDALNNVDVYMRSNWTQEAFGGGFALIPGPNPGDDANDGLTPLTPIETFEALYCKFGTKASGYAAYNVHLADASSPNNGFDGGIDCPPLYYQVEEMRVGGGACNANSYTYTGPDRMRTLVPLGALTAQSVDGTYPGATTIATFGGAAFQPDGLSSITGFFIAIAASGNYVMSVMPLIRNTATDLFLPDNGIMGTFNLLPGNATYYVGRPGAVISTWRDYDPLITGLGCYRAGLLENSAIQLGPDPNAQNPRPTFRNMEIPGFRLQADGVSFDSCGFLDHRGMATGSTVEFKNCRGSGGMYLHGTSGRIFGWRNNTTGNGTNREYTSYIPAGVTVDNPFVGCDLILTQKAPNALSAGLYLGGGQLGAATQLGSEDSHHIGQFLVYRGLYGYGLSTPLVYGSGASDFGMVDQSALVGHNVLIGIHLSGKAEARVNAGGAIDPTGLRFTGTLTAAFRLGKGTVGDPQVDVSLADFMNPAIWNRNLCTYRPHIPANYLGAGIPVAAVYPYGCMARIYDGAV